MSRRIPTNRAGTALRAGRALSTVREAHGVTRAELVRRVGWTADRLAGLEEGRAEEAWLAVLELLDAMDADLEELWTAYRKPSDERPPADEPTPT